MKRIFLIVALGIALLYSCVGDAASYITLQYHVVGVTDKDVLKNIQNTLDNLYKKQHVPLKRHEAMRFYDEAPKQIYNAVTPYGYFQATTQSRLSEQETPKGLVWVAEFNVTLGPALLVKKVDIDIEGQGRYDPLFEKWLQKSSIKAGKPLHTKDYEDAKTDLYNMATEHGYFSATLKKNEIQINKRLYEATIILIFDTGPRARFGNTTFTKTPLYTSFLDKYPRYKKGEYYDAAKLDATQTALVNSTYFDQVIIKPDPHHIQNGEVPISVKLIPRHKKDYTFGLGYGTDTGIRGTLGYTSRFLNGYGHRFQTMIRASQKNSNAVIRYLMPGSDPANDLYTLFAGATTIEQDTGNARSVKFGGEYATLRGPWKYSIQLAYLNEQYNLTNLPQTTTQLVFPTFNAKYLQTNNSRNPKRGVSLAFQLTGANKALLSATTFYQALIQLKSLYTIDKTNTRLLFRTSLGHTMIQDINNLPLSLQLFAGGSQSVRGYSFNSLGPGRNLFTISGEVQQKAYKDFYAAWFLDAGKVTDNNPFTELNAGTGPGIAWVSSIGALELTFAKAFTQPGDPWAIQFVMGTAL